MPGISQLNDMVQTALSAAGCYQKLFFIPGHDIGYDDIIPGDLVSTGSDNQADFVPACCQICKPVIQVAGNWYVGFISHFDADKTR